MIYLKATSPLLNDFEGVRLITMVRSICRAHHVSFTGHAAVATVPKGKAAKNLINSTIPSICAVLQAHLRL